MASEAPHIEARRAQRRETQASSTLRANGMAPHDVVVHDISRTGVRFSCEACAEPGDQVSIGLAGVGAVRAVVAWVADGQCGCTFLEPIADEDVAHAFSAQTVVPLATSPRVIAADAAPLAPVPPTLREEVDALYARHRMWRLPLDVWAFGTALLVAAVALWSLLR